MKKLFSFLTFTFLLLNFEFTSAQNVGIGTSSPQAALDVSSTTNGFLPPRMTFAQRAAIVNPAAGLIVYCIDCGAGVGELAFFDGVSWKTTSVAGVYTGGTPPLAPSNLNVTVSSPLQYASLTWTDISANELGYKIERKSGSGISTQIAQVGTNVTTFNDSTIGQSTTYMYRVYAFNNAGNSAQYSNEIEVTTYAVPTLTTNSITSITGDFAISGGNITSSGGAAVTGSGVCWSTSANPTIALSTFTYDYFGTDGFTSYINGLTPNTTYHVRAYATNAVGTAYGGDSVFTTLPILLPTLTTSSVLYILNTTAICGGDVTFDGNTEITERGICWSTSANPTIDLATKTIDGAGTGVFTSNITGLTANTTYYVRAYATNSLGTSYGTQVSFTTSNYSFVNLPSVTIGTQIWTTKNLDVAKYRNGDPIPQVTDNTQWQNLTTGAWCWYNNDSVTYAATYGRLYNCYAVNDPRGLAPQGWHVPSDAEWNKLVKSIDFSADTTCQNCSQSAIAGGAMKETGTSHWTTPNTGATNTSGFTGLPGGYRLTNGTFGDIGINGVWWSTLDINISDASGRDLLYNISDLKKLSSNFYVKSYAFSVRLVRD